MSFNDDFFNYSPVAVGVVIDVDKPFVLRAVKSALVDYIHGLESITEDKVILYGRHKGGQLPKMLGETVSDISIYKQPAWFAVEEGLSQSLRAISQVDDGYSRTVLYFTDRMTESQARRLKRTVDLSATHYSGTKFVVVDLGSGNKELYDFCYKNENVVLVVVPASNLTGVLLKEAIDG